MSVAYHSPFSLVIVTNTAPTAFVARYSQTFSIYGKITSCTFNLFIEWAECQWHDIKDREYGNKTTRNK